MKERELFLAALEIDDPAARRTHLQAECGDDAQLLARVESLLASHEGQSQFLNTPAVEQIADDSEPEIAATILAGNGSTEDEQLEATKAFHSNGPEAMTEHQDDSADEIPLGYLEPSSKPGSIGRLAHYEVLDVIGRGAFGTVLRAFDEKLQRVVAIKVMAPEMAATSPARKRFLREAQASAAIRHEHVVSIYAVEEKPIPYLVMEYIPGRTLQQRLDERGPLDLATVLRIGRQIAEGLAAAHAQDLIHRDIKPGNILLESSVLDRVKITDFGLARAADDASLTQSGTIAGTPMYMAPEQALGKKLDQRADLFSFGSVLYQMVSGRPPFRANGTLAVLKRVTEDTPRPIREIIPEAPQWLCDIITKLHAKNPDERYQSAREIADVLANCEEQLKAHAGLKDFTLIPAATTKPAPRWKWVAAMALIVPLLAFGLYAVNRPGAQPKVAENETTPKRSVLDAIKPDTALATNQVTEQGAPESDVWVQLFNGKDLTGWKTHPDLPGNWKVDGGILVGSTIPSYLFSDSGKFANFHLRVEAKVSRGGDSGVYFRTPFSMRTGRTADQRRPAAGYEVEMQANPANLLKTGSVWDAERVGSPPKALWQTKEESLTKADEWFTLEIIAYGNRVISKVNGIQTADCNDPLSKYEVGHLALQIYSPETTVQFRKIEIKELPPSDPVVPSWVQLFNGKDLTGWKFHPKQPGDWNVKDGILYGSTRQSFLFSERGDYENFHLRAEVKINAGGDSGIMFRSPFEVPGSTSNAFGCYEAELQQNRQYARPTGSISETPGDAPPNILSRALDGSLTRPDEWFTYEVIAVNNHFVTKINGIEAANCSDALDRHRTGHLVLQVWSPKTVVQFRKIEIKELIASPPASPPPLAKAPFDAEKAKQHQKAWADYLGVPVEKELSLGQDKDGKDVTLTMVLIPPGEFMIGATDDEQKKWLATAKSGNPNAQADAFATINMEDQRFVRITKPFWLSKLEFTTGQFRRFVEGTGGYKTDAETNGQGAARYNYSTRSVERLPELHWDNWGKFSADAGPVVNVSWNDAAKCCEWLTSQHPDMTFSLPTEAQWEFACRAGTKNSLYDCETSEQLREYAQFGDEVHFIQRGGQLRPNAFGLYDMLGNVSEWCSNWLEGYAQSPTDDPAGPAVHGKYEMRAIRGGSFIAKVWRVRSSKRDFYPPDDCFFDRGFRVAATVLLDVIPSKSQVKWTASANAEPVTKQKPPAPTHKNSIGMEFVFVPKGKSWLGGGKDKLGDKEVEFATDFYLGKYEVTQAEWEQVMGENPSHFSRTGGGKDEVVDIPDADLQRFPVENVSWDQCQMFVEKLNSLTKEPGWIYRLPKQTEWEYACRGGPMTDKADSAFDFYFAKPTNNPLRDQTLVGINKGPNRTIKVGSTEANRLGLFDMHRNVCEWCDDMNDAAKASGHEVHVGGGWNGIRSHSAAANSESNLPSHRSSNLGLRLARVPADAASSAAKLPPPAAPFTDADIQ